MEGTPEREVHGGADHPRSDDVPGREQGGYEETAGFGDRGYGDRGEFGDQGEGRTAERDPGTDPAEDDTAET